MALPAPSPAVTAAPAAPPTAAPNLEATVERGGKLLGLIVPILTIILGLAGGFATYRATSAVQEVKIAQLHDDVQELKAGQAEQRSDIKQILLLLRK